MSRNSLGQGLFPFSFSQEPQRIEMAIVSGSQVSLVRLHRGNLTNWWQTQCQQYDQLAYVTTKENCYTPKRYLMKSLLFTTLHQKVRVMGVVMAGASSSLTMGQRGVGANHQLLTITWTHGPPICSRVGGVAVHTMSWDGSKITWRALVGPRQPPALLAMLRS